jgi:hypothetical protein
MIIHILCIVKVSNVLVFAFDLKKNTGKKMHCKASDKAEPEHLVPRRSNENHCIVLNNPAGDPAPRVSIK